MGLYERFFDGLLLVDPRNRMARREALRSEGVFLMALLESLSKKDNFDLLDTQLKSLGGLVLTSQHLKRRVRLPHQGHPYLHLSRTFAKPHKRWTWNFYTSPDGIIPRGVLLSNTMSQHSTDQYFLSIHPSELVSNSQLEEWISQTPFVGARGILASKNDFVLNPETQRPDHFDRHYEFFLYSFVWTMYLNKRTTRIQQPESEQKPISSFSLQPAI